jgi:hypothetical protein
LVGKIELLPHTLRSSFMPIETGQMAIEESRRDRAALWQEIRDLRHRLDKDT